VLCAASSGVPSNTIEDSYNPDVPAKPKPAVDDFSDLNITEPLPILIHATDGNGKNARATKVKLSTIVKPEDMEGFFIRYADVCKAGMVGLKKRDRKGRKAKKRKGAALPPPAGAGKA